MKHKKGILEQVVHGMELTSEIMPKESLIELIAGKRLLIEHHHGITQYGCEDIHVKLIDGEIYITGKGLSIVLMTQDKMIITGKIECIKTVQTEWR